MHSKTKSPGQFSMSGRAVGRVRACFKSSPKTSTRRGGFVWNCVRNARFTAVAASVYPYSEQTNSFVVGYPFSKLVASSGSGAQ